MKPELSIAIVVNNAEATLAITIDRLLDFGSNFGGRFDILIIDNKSTDDTFAVASSLARAYPQIEVHHNKVNEAEAIQTAMRYTTGDQVLVCHSHVTIGEIRDLLKFGKDSDFVMASVFGNRTVVRRTYGDEILPHEPHLVDASNVPRARLISRSRMVADIRYDERHDEPVGQSRHLRPLNRHSAVPNLTQPRSK